MNRFQNRACARTQGQNAQNHLDSKMPYLLSAEQQLLQAMSNHAPLSEILNGICAALDCQIGNMVSLVSLSGQDASVFDAIALKATHFGLYAFCSEEVFAENDEVLGSLEMYCSVPRSPTRNERKLIERATSLAALAIQLHKHEQNHGSLSSHWKGGMEKDLSEEHSSRTE
jgi:hypothetical protein